MTRILILGLMVAVCHLASAQECDDKTSEDNRLDFERVFHSRYYGPVMRPAPTKERMLEALGTCITPGQFARNMINFYTSYGPDLSHIQEPFMSFDGSNYTLNIQVVTDNNWIYTSVYKDMAQFMNVKSYWCGWILTAKQRFTGPAGTLDEDKVLFYGIERFSLNGKDECVTYFSKRSDDFSLTAGTLTWDMVALHDEWGRGSVTGSYNVLKDSMAGSDAFYIFPRKTD